MNTTPIHQRLFFVDSSIYVFHAWHRHPERFDHEKRPVNAVYGFIKFLLEFLPKINHAPVGFAFDQSLQHCFRREIYPAYKANRKPAPESLKFQFRQCRALLDCLGAKHWASDYYEADDLLGSWMQFYRAQGHPVTVLTADKDLAQLIKSEDEWWDFHRYRRFNRTQLSSYFKSPPERMAELLAIAGDKSDNIPGVPGIGMAGASKLLQHFSSIDELISQYETISKLKIRNARFLQKAIQNHHEAIRLAYQLTQIKCDIPVTSTQQLSQLVINNDTLIPFLRKLRPTEDEFLQWMNGFNRLNVKN